MKKVFVAAIVLLASVKTFAQKNEGEFKPFKVDVSLGYAIPTSGGSGAKGGVLFVVEPNYAVMSQVSVGLRLESAIMVAGISANGTVSNSASAKATGSYLATGDYYFNNNNFRPFAGAGLGIFKTAAVTLSSGNNSVAAASKFGGMIRAGFEYKHARVGLEYNLVGKSTVAPSSSTANDGYTIKNGYLGIKFGFCIGGGRR